MKSIASMLFVLTAALLLTSSTYAGYAAGMNQYAAYHVMSGQTDPSGLYPGSEGHGSITSPSNAVEIVRNAQERADEAWEKNISSRGHYVQIKWHGTSLVKERRNFYRLAHITDNAIVGYQNNNRFIYTCKYGWIDMGHFFTNAMLTYRYNRGIARAGSYFNEVWQDVTDSDSAWTPEDMMSNFHGRQFGKSLYKQDEFNISQVNSQRDVERKAESANLTAYWKRFLIDAGAVKWSEPKVQGQTVEEILLDDLDDFKATWKPDVDQIESREQAIDWYRKRRAYKCLCDGDVPKYKGHYFGGD